MGESSTVPPCHLLGRGTVSARVTAADVSAGVSAPIAAVDAAAVATRLKHSQLCGNKSAMGLKLSAFAHVIPGPRPGTLALWNSLRLKPIFVSAEIYAGLRLRYNALPAIPLSASNHCADSGEAEPALHSVSVLVDDQLDEEEVLANYQQQLTGHPDIHVCYLLLTDECNLRCKYCFIQNSLSRSYQRSAMTNNTAATAVTFFHEAAMRGHQRHPDLTGEYTLLFYGGEPCLNPTALASALHQAHALTFPGPLKIAMVTNGTRITPDIAALLKQHEVGVSVSMDGPAVITDRFRNRGTYAGAIAGFEELRAAGINPGVSCTIPPAALERFKETCEWLSTLEVRNVGFNLVTRPAQGFSSVEYYRSATELLLQAFSQFRDEGVFEDRIMRKVRAFAEATPYPFDCAACGGAQIVVAPDGQVGICHALLGTRETFVGTIYDSMFFPEDHPAWHEWSRRSPLNMSACKNCRCLGICGGGCPINGRNGLWGLDEAFCVHAKTILDWLVWDVYKHASANI
ncbi:MAG: radical SAM protein [Acidobacteriaceae bacterium]